jgi:hypothetical protein
MNPSDQSAVRKHTSETGALGPELQAYIGRQLRSLYDEVLKEPLPERLRALLAELENKSYGSS